LLGGAVGGLLIGDMVSDAGFDDGGGFDFWFFFIIYIYIYISFGLVFMGW
jgi:hypothetical protein